MEIDNHRYQTRRQEMKNQSLLDLSFLTYYGVANNLPRKSINLNRLNILYSYHIICDAFRLLLEIYTVPI